MKLALFLSSVFVIINKHIHCILHYRCINLLVKVRFKKTGECFF